jgi:uncharacterized membrane protein HdeD (DUF308 family)
MITDDVITTAYNRSKWALILRGLLGLAVGIYIFMRPAQSLAAFSLFIAIWALLDGITNIARAFTVRGIAPHWWVLLLTGLVSVAFGVAALYYYPVLSLAFAVVWVALWLLTSGVMAVYIAIQERRADVPWGWTMTFGVIAIVASVLDYMYPGITLAWLMGLIGGFAIISGIAMLVAAGKLQSIKRHVKDATESHSRAA